MDEIDNGFGRFIRVVVDEIDRFCSGMDQNDFAKAVEMIVDSEKRGGRLHVTGIGKPGHVAGYIASLFSSTGTPAYELHGTEAVHGSSGQVLAGDVVVAISNSGETLELKSTVDTLKNNGALIIGVSGDKNSWLAHISDIFLFAGVPFEGDPINKAPRMSVLAEMIVLQTLSVMLQCKKDLTVKQYVKWHPHGALGQVCIKEL